MLGRLGMDVDDCIEAYTGMFADIFKHKNWSKVNWKGDVKPQYDSKILESKIREIIIGERTSEKENGSSAEAEVSLDDGRSHLHNVDQLTE
jgi:hypothetical protein